VNKILCLFVTVQFFIDRYLRVQILLRKVTNQNPASTEGGENPVSLAKLGKVDDRYDKALSQVFTPAEINSFQKVRKAVTDLSRLSGVRTTTGSNTAEDIQHGLTVREALLKTHFGELKGGGEMRSIKLFGKLTGLMDEGTRASTVIARAMRDPELAAHLLERPVTKAIVLYGIHASTN